MNQIVLVGRLTANPEMNNNEKGIKVTSVVIAVPRPFKNSEGLYETDFIKCILWNNLASNTVEFCKKGDVVGIKGRLEISSYETEEGIKKYTTEVIAERISFLSSNNEKKN